MIYAKLPLYDEIKNSEARQKMIEIFNEIEEYAKKIDKGIEYLTSVFERGLALCFRSKPSKIRSSGYGFIVLRNDGIYRQWYENGHYRSFSLRDMDDMNRLLDVRDAVIESAKSSQKGLIREVMKMIAEYAEKRLYNSINLEIEVTTDANYFSKEPQKRSLEISVKPPYVYFRFSTSSYYHPSINFDSYVDNLYLYPIYDHAINLLIKTKEATRKRLEDIEEFLKRWDGLIRRIEVMWKFKEGNI